MGVSKERGGLDWGTGSVSLARGLVIAALVAVLAVTKMDVPQEG